jgi:hypothetical protein
MALFGSDRPVMPSFRTAPELDSSQPSPYNDLNRAERSVDRNSDRNSARLDRDGRRDDRDARDERNSYERNDLDRHLERDRMDVSRRESVPERVVERAIPVVERPVSDGFGTVNGRPQQSHALIEGLFSKLPQPETEWSLQSRQKWLQTAANIFDLMYVPSDAEAGELTIRVERTSQH